MTFLQRLRQLFEAGFSLTAIVLPASMALTRLAVDPAWRSDLPALRGLGLVPVGGATTLSMIAMQLVSFVPLGTLSFRIAIASALGLVACAWLLQSIARQLLEANVPGSFMNAPLASIAALTAGLGPALQGEATVGGGATIELAASLLALHAWMRPDDLRVRRWTLTALVLGALVSESLVAAGAVAVALVASAIAKRDLLGWREARFPIGALLVSAGLGVLPWILRPIAPNAWLRLGWSLTTGGLVSLDTEAVRTTALSAWINEVGWVSLALAVLGLAAGLLRSRTRSYAVPLAVLILADVLFPATTGAVLTVDPWIALRMLAISGVSMLAALGVQSIASTLIDMNIPMSRAAAVLLLMFNLTLVAVASEQSAFTIDRGEVRGAEAWADEGLDRLDPNAVVLARSHALAWRMLGDRLLCGRRPDLVLVPMPLITRGTVAHMVLQAAPNAAMLMRDMALDGAPGEHAVSRVADSRAVYAEYDPRWDVRVAMHLAPEALWLRLYPQPLGKSDRKMSLERTEPFLQSVLAASRKSDPQDKATLAVVRSMLRQQAVSCGMARDRDAMKTTLARLEGLDAEDLILRALRLRLEHATPTEVDVSGLLH